MNFKFRRFLPIWLLELILLSLVVADEDHNALDVSGKNTAELLRLRGYMASNHHITTDDGYVLNLVRCTNPKINGGRRGLKRKSAVLFLHGTLSNARSFLSMSDDVRPKDYSKYDASEMSEQELAELLANEPSVNSLAFLLLNFGHEIWLLNRRGTPESLGRADGMNGTGKFDEEHHNPMSEAFTKIKTQLTENSTAAKIISAFAGAIKTIYDLIGKKVVNQEYWNFSLDEQAQFDFPTAVDYIRHITRRKKISVVGHSAGGAIVLMALAQQPKLALKIDQAVLWAPAVNLGHSFGERLKFRPLNMFTKYLGPLPPMSPGPNIPSKLCKIDDKGKNAPVCMLFMNAFFGLCGDHQRFKRGEMLVAGNPIGSRELAQFGQNLNFDGVQHHYDFGSEEKNREIYGTAKPPAYDFSRITLKTITFFVGKTDGLVAPEDVEFTHKALSVSADYKLIAGDDGMFNHVGFLFNENAGIVSHIPSLMKLENTSDKIFANSTKQKFELFKL